jgi:hypothetical protein
MVLYVAFVAITNVCIGFTVGHILHSPKNRSDDDELWDTDIDDRACSKSNCDADHRQNRASEVNDEDVSSDTQSLKDESPSKSHSDHTWIGDKCEFATQLREVTERASYCRGARDKTLLRQAAEQVLSCISQRYDELQHILSASDGNERLIGAALDGVEMLSAQIETSISNLRALDWSAPVDDVGVRLDCELTLLNEQQRMLSSMLRTSKS